MTVDVEHWRAVILAADSRPKAKKQLGCSFKELKDFRAQYMPDHAWPDKRQPEDIAREQFEARERKRERRALEIAHTLVPYVEPEAREPNDEDVDAALLRMNPRQMEALESFAPGLHPRHHQKVHHDLMDMGLLQAPLRPSSNANLSMKGDLQFTPLGRATHARLKSKA